MDDTPQEAKKQEELRSAIGLLVFEASEYGVKYGRLYAISGVAAARGGTEDDLAKVDAARDALYALLGIRKLEQE